MNYYIAVFSSRTLSFAFNDTLARNGIPCKIINTPNKAQVGCGICVKFMRDDLMRVKKLSETIREFSQAAFYQVTSMNSLSQVTRV